MRAVREGVGCGEGTQGSSPSRGWCRARAGVEKDTVVEEKTKANRVLGSSAGGAGQEGEKDGEVERKRDAGLFQMLGWDRG